jgi:hypothetical protein
MTASALSEAAELLADDRDDQRLNTIIHNPKCVFVRFPRFRRCRMRVVLPELGGIPLLHRGHGMIGSG